MLSGPAKYVVITQLVRLEDQGDGADGEDDDLVSYHINDALFDCIRRAAPHPFIKERKLVERQPPPRPWIIRE